MLVAKLLIVIFGIFVAILSLYQILEARWYHDSQAKNIACLIFGIGFTILGFYLLFT